MEFYVQVCKNVIESDNPIGKKYCLTKLTYKTIC